MSYGLYKAGNFDVENFKVSSQTCVGGLGA